MGHRIRPTAARQFAPADLVQGILVVSSFGFLGGDARPDAGAAVSPLAGRLTDARAGWLTRGSTCVQNAGAAAIRILKHPR
ncbi:hypothetical protein [Bradyrhizobium sp. USDA 327]|uniref:hypothetical protein n=1 Tax=Bradyrhizobium sp. USDA 327 TaxID=3156308 RepID=UPI0035198A11